MMLLYDLERYAGDQRAPGYKPGAVRFFLNVFLRRDSKRFHSLLWTASAQTYEGIRALVPSGGRHFDRSGNYPSPMVPIEGWHFDEAPPAPVRAKAEALDGG